jgi:hypothetical protein
VRVELLVEKTELEVEMAGMVGAGGFALDKGGLNCNFFEEMSGSFMFSWDEELKEEEEFTPKPTRD